MTRLILPVLVLFPAIASACGPMAAMRGSSAHGCGGAGPIALMAAVAVLGVWILRLVDNDSRPVKRAGQVVGWTLAAVGLGGFLCGALSYGLKKGRQGCPTPPSGAITVPDTKLPPGHPPIGASLK